MKAFAGEGSFKALLAEDEELRARLLIDVLERCFDLSHVLRHAGTIVDRALEAP